jgi:hypothetical protein
MVERRRLWEGRFMIDAAEVLALLDELVADNEFPVLDSGYTYLFDTRLTVFSHDPRWAIVVEILGYNPRLGPDVCDFAYSMGTDMEVVRSGDGRGKKRALRRILDRVNAADNVDDEDPERVTGGSFVVHARGHVAATDVTPGEPLEWSRVSVATRTNRTLSDGLGGTQPSLNRSTTARCDLRW